jgi:hypothetical protein
LLRLSACGAGERGGGSDACCENTLGDFHFSILLIDLEFLITVLSPLRSMCFRSLGHWGLRLHLIRPL